MGATKHFYADDDALGVIDSLDRGEISKIVNQALKEHSGRADSLEVVNRRLDNVYQEKAELEGKIKFLEKRKKQLEKQHKEEQAAKKKLEQEKGQKRKQKLETLNEFFVENIGRDMTEEDLNNYENSECRTILEFIDKIKEVQQ